MSDVSEVSDSLSQETTGLNPPSLARTRQFLKNLQEAERTRTRKSKVAESALANLSGDGVMFGDKNEPDTDPVLALDP